NYDLANGLVKDTPLKAVTLTAGSSTTITITMTALRRWHVTLTRSATPLGNAQGAADLIATPDQVPGQNSKLFGSGRNDCAKMTGTQTAEVNGFIFGNGPYYGIALLNDYGTNGGLPPGSLTSLAIDGGGPVNP